MLPASLEAASAGQKQLSLKQASFAREYLVDFNATQAAIRAGYTFKSAGRCACRLLDNSKVRCMILSQMQERNKRIQISQDRVLEELARIAFAEFGDVASWGPEGLTLKNSGELTPEQSATISEVAVSLNRHGRSSRIKQHDKLKALELLMRHMGMLHDNLKLSGELDLAILEKARERAKERLQQNAT